MEKKEQMQIIMSAVKGQWSKFKEFINYMIDSKTRESKRISKYLSENLSNPRFQKIIRENGWKKSMSKDYLAIEVLKHAKAKFNYVGELGKWNKVEFWESMEILLTHWYVWSDSNKTKVTLVHIGDDSPEEFPEAFLCCDCETGATYIWCLLKLLKCEVYLMGGNVLLNKTIGGHAWVDYISPNTPYVHKFLDWCFAYTYKTVKNRPSFMLEKDKSIKGDDPRYLEFWFFSNEEGSYRKIE